MIRETKDGVNVRILYKYYFYLWHSRQIRESKVLFLFLLLLGGHFATSHVQFFGVWKDKNFVLKGVWKGKNFVSKGVLNGKNCVQYCISWCIDLSKILFSRLQISESIPFLFMERRKLCRHPNHSMCDFPPQLMHFNLLPELRERRSRITKPINGLLNSITVTIASFYIFFSDTHLKCPEESPYVLENGHVWLLMLFLHKVTINELQYMQMCCESSTRSEEHCQDSGPLHLSDPSKLHKYIFGKISL